MKTDFLAACGFFALLLGIALGRISAEPQPADNCKLPVSNLREDLGEPDLVCQFWRDESHHFRYGPKQCYTVQGNEYRKD